MPVGDRPRPRFGRILFLGSLLAFAAAAGAFWPQIWAAATTESGVFRRAKKRFDLWRGLAQGSDPRIKRVIKNLDRPVAGATSGGGVKGVTRY
jgi:hypothetical protein